MKHTYRCWLYQTRVLKDAEIRWSRYVELPFVPSKDVAIRFSPDDDAPGSDFVPESVEYVVGADVFWCEEMVMSDDCSCKEGEGCCVDNEESRQFQLDGGWTLQEVRKGEERLYAFPWIFGTTIHDKRWRQYETHRQGPVETV